MSRYHQEVQQVALSLGSDPKRNISDPHRMEPANIQIYDALMDLKRKALYDHYSHHFSNILLDTAKHGGRDKTLQDLEQGYCDFMDDEGLVGDSVYAYTYREENGIIIVIAAYSPPTFHFS